jgi:hypothetical protein
MPLSAKRSDASEGRGRSSFRRPTANQLAEEEKAKRSAEEELKRTADFVALLTIIGYILKAMPLQQSDAVKSSLKDLVASRLGEEEMLMSPEQEQVYRNRLSWVKLIQHANLRILGRVAFLAESQPHNLQKGHRRLWHPPSRTPG